MQLSTPRKTLLVTFFVTMLVFSTACIHADMGVSVKDDGSGTITLLQAVDAKAFADAMKQFGGMMGGTSSSSPSSPSDIFNENDIDKSKLPPGSTVEKYKNGNLEGVKVTTPFSKPEDVLPTLNKVAEALEDLGDLGSLGGGGTTSSRPTTSGTTRPGASPTPARSASSGTNPSDAFDKFSLAKTSDGWKFEATAKSVGDADIGNDPMTQALMASILKDASVTFTLRMPGKVTQTNADSNKNGELKWNLPLTSAQPKAMSATTVGSGTSSGGGDGDDGGFPVMIIVAVVAAVFVVGGLYYWSKQKQAQPPAPPPPPVPGTSV
jgi:hypothetical protein